VKIRSIFSVSEGRRGKGMMWIVAMGGTVVKSGETRMVCSLVIVSFLV